LLFRPVDEVPVHVESRNSCCYGIDIGCLAQAKLSVCSGPCRDDAAKRLPGNKAMAGLNDVFAEA
jgi:hypothetical protein